MLNPSYNHLNINNETSGHRKTKLVYATFDVRQINQLRVREKAQ